MEEKNIRTEVLNQNQVDAIDEKLNSLHQQLVPISGMCNTLKGELVRSAMRMVYRYWNDGDVCNRGYGIQTVWSSWNFIMDKASKEVTDLAVELDFCKNDEEYNQKLHVMVSLLIDQINDGNYDVPNDIDSRVYKSNERPEELEDDEEDYEEWD